jgi:hypothetical protein
MRACVGRCHKTDVRGAAVEEATYLKRADDRRAYPVRVGLDFGLVLA